MSTGTHQNDISTCDASYAAGQPFDPPFNWSELESAYNRDGFVLVGGLVPPTALAAAETAVWAAISAELGWERGNASTWPPCGEAAVWVPGSAVASLFSPLYLEAARRLSQHYTILAGSPLQDITPITPPEQDMMSINIFPCLNGTGWSMPPPHLDHSNKDDYHRAFPMRPVRISAMTYLTETRPSMGGAHGAGTIVWPGSSRLVERLARRDPKRFALMWDLWQSLAEAGVGVTGSECQPLELSPRAGDVLFYDIFEAHSGSNNTSPRPRLALNTKWGSGRLP